MELIEEGVVASPVIEVVSVSAQKEETAEELLVQYMHVQRCWNDYDLAVKDGMTTGRAIKTLVGIRDSKVAPKSLRSRAAQLLHCVIYKQDEVIVK